MPPSALSVPLQNLGPAYKPQDPNARWELLRLVLEEGMSVTKALTAVGCSWASVARWKADDPQWRTQYASARETLADAHADAALEVLDAAVLTLPKVDAKASSAYATLAREKSAAHRWRASVQNRRSWSDKDMAEGTQAVSVSIYLPAKDDVPASALAAIASAEHAVLDANPLLRQQLALSPPTRSPLNDSAVNYSAVNDSAVNDGTTGGR